MARLRGSPRRASRHTGETYGRGHQYNDPERDILRFGPWDEVWPLGKRMVPTNILQSLEDGMLEDGIIYPVWGRSKTTQSNRTTVGAFEFGLTADVYFLQFFRDRGDSDKLKLFRDNGSSSTTVDTTLTSASERIIAAPWQNRVYFGHESVGSLYYWNQLDDTVNAVLGSPANSEFLFVLHNNLVSIHQSGTAYIVKWAVDSDPDDWSGAGSGSVVLSGKIGNPQGVGLLGNSAIIVGSKGAMRLVPTGIASPAFRIEEVEEIEGCAFKHAVHAEEGVLVYVTHERRVAVWSGGRPREAGRGEESFNVAPVVFYSTRLNRIIISCSDPKITLFMDPRTLKWVSDLPESFDFISDTPTSGAVGNVLAYKNDSTSYDVTTFDLDPSTYKQPVFKTGRQLFGGHFHVDHIDLIRTGIEAPTPGLRAFRILRKGLVVSDSFLDKLEDPIEELETVARYFVNNYSEGLEIHLSVSTDAGPFDIDNPTSAGNLPIDLTNPTTHRRANLDSNDNFLVNDTTNEYAASGFTDEGNLILVKPDSADVDQWDKNTGIERIEVPVRKLDKGSTLAA